MKNLAHVFLHRREPVLQRAPGLEVWSQGQTFPFPTYLRTGELI